MLSQDKDQRSQQLGLILIGLGALLVLINLGVFRVLAPPLGAILFFAGGAAFLVVFSRDRQQWWALIPGFALLGLGVAALGGGAAGSWFLGLIGAGFAAIYLSDSRHWWAIIPAGALVTLALTAWVGSGWLAGPLLFAGLAGTFILLYLLPEGQGKQSWALYPALGLGAFTILVLVTAIGLPSVVWSLLLIAAGGWLVWRQR